MKARTAYTSARRIQRQIERMKRVRAGVPNARLDWKCPVCKGWYSNYRGRNTIHLRHCEKKRGEQSASEMIRRRVQAPL